MKLCNRYAPAPERRERPRAFRPGGRFHILSTQHRLTAANLHGYGITFDCHCRMEVAMRRLGLTLLVLGIFACGGKSPFGPTPRLDVGDGGSGSDGGSDNGGGADLTMAQGAPDLAMPGSPDLSVGGGHFGCRSAITCAGACNPNDQTCFDNCFNMINTPNGAQYLMDYLTCVSNACPANTATDPCSQSNPNVQTACAACVHAAQTGTCGTAAHNCSADG
jgi:hypothetical protein